MSFKGIVYQSISYKQCREQFFWVQLQLNIVPLVFIELIVLSIINFQQWLILYFVNKISLIQKGMT
jgi:hypothetical protein